MSDENRKFNRIIFYYRIVFTVVGWSTLFLILFMRVFILETEGSIFLAALRPYRYYTIQTNLWVNLWNTFSLVWYNKKKRSSDPMNWLQGAVTLYITVTFLVYAAVLDGLYTPPTLIDYIVDVTTHFVMPISTIFGWIFTGRRIRYSWKILPIWIIYPILYLLFALIHGTITGDYLYPFLNIEKLGKWAFLVSVLILIGVYLGLGSIYIVINRKSTKKGKN